MKTIGNPVQGAEDGTVTDGTVTEEGSSFFSPNYAWKGTVTEVEKMELEQIIH